MIRSSLTPYVCVYSCLSLALAQLGWCSRNHFGLVLVLLILISLSESSKLNVVVLLSGFDLAYPVFITITSSSLPWT